MADLTRDMDSRVSLECKNVWPEINHRLTDFSIDFILSPTGPGKKETTEESTDSQPQFDWLQCTRYRPPKLQRVRRKEGTQRRKPGRNPRIPFSGTQVAVLEERFRIGHYLSSAEVEKLSSLLCLSETRVKIWFQNRRARERRERDINQSDSTTPDEKPKKIQYPAIKTELKGEHNLISSITSAFSPCQPLNNHKF